jgi:ribosomal protein S18 acetylase RimI-like enzyme
MNLRSLAYRTDLIFPSFDGEIIDRGRYLVVRTPSNPTFYWGNFLLFDRPPAPADVMRWPKLFAEEIGGPPLTHHQTFGWDSPEGETGAAQAFEALGFRLLRSAVLSAVQVNPPPHFAPEVDVRTLQTDDEWRLATENQIRCREEGHDESGYRLFKEREMRRYRAMASAGRGAWFGAFLGEALVADLGIFHQGRLGRFQSVETDPSYRRRGFAGTLVYQSARHALGSMPIDTLVLVADAGEPPDRLYRSVGFQQVEFAVGLERWSPVETRA